MQWKQHRAGSRLVAIALCFLAAVAGGASSLYAGLILGQLDNFQSGPASWTNGPGAADPTVVANGQNGASDDFLQVHSAGGAGAGSKLTTFNRTQWVGDYTGTTAITMDLKNLGSSALSMRIAFRQGTANGQPGYVSTVPFSLPADSAWHHATFSLDSAALTKIGAANALATFLQSPAELRIISEGGSTPTSLDGDTIVATVGIDNIDAVPEPTVLVMLLAGMVCVPSLYRRRLR